MGRRFAIRDMKTSLLFDGSNDYITIAHDSWQLLTGGFSISAWIKVKSYGTSGRIVDKTASTSAASGFGFGLRNSGAPSMSLYCQINAGTQINAPDACIVRNKWFHVTCTVTAAGLVSFYIDGVLVGTPAVSAACSGITTTNDLRIGNRSTATDRPFDGLMDGLRIFNRALTAAEILDLMYKNLKPLDSSTSLMLEFLMDEGTGTTATDTSGNGRNGTITGPVYNIDTRIRERFSVVPQAKCIDFSAATDNIDCGADWIGTGAISISVWINPRTVGPAGGTGGRIIDNGKFSLQLNTTIGKEFRFSSDNFSTIATSGNYKITFQKWQFLTITRNAAGLTNFYLNGQQVGTAGQASGTPVAGTTNVIIGNRSALDRNFDGKIANLIVHNKILTQAEILALYNRGVVPDGALANFPFDNSLADISGNGHTGTATGTTFSSGVRQSARTKVTSPRFRVRDFGTALQFDGSTTKIVRAMTDNAVTKWACSFWVKIHTESNRHNFIYRGNGNSNYPRVYSKAANNMLISCQYSMTGQASQAFDGVTKLKKDIWYHVVFTIDGDAQRAKLYLNGVLENSQTPNGGAGATVSSSTSSLSIGNDTNLSLWLNGKMDNVNIWRGYAPDANEVFNMYKLGYVPGTPYIRYLLDEGSGSTAVDSSGNGLDGTITGGTYTSDVPCKNRTANS